ncbi:MAG TPA: glycosyltransferase family 4 protein, partial [Pirellulales bacterium]|nr:glycosyltransferase family 4 protein [Pirellulales bacterium]
LVAWLADEVKPDVVHLSNSMLGGMTHEIVRRLQVPVVCTLSGEDMFVERLPPLWYGRVREELRQRAAEVSHFVAFNRYYAEFMHDYLHVDRAKITVIPHGLKLEGHGSRQSSADNEFRIGYFARIAPEKGLHHLVDAFKILATDESLPRLRLRIAGYMNSADRPYFEDLQNRIAESGLADRVEYHGELSREAKIAFMQGLDVMSVPTTYREAKGLSILEALANAVPVVLPAHGAFPEMIEDTGGGLLCEPNDPADLARALKQLVVDRSLVESHGRMGQDAIRDRYHSALMAERHHTLYEQVVDEHRRANPPLAPGESPVAGTPNIAAPTADAMHP